jgi:hypothetical protein
VHQREALQRVAEADRAPDDLEQLLRVTRAVNLPRARRRDGARGREGALRLKSLAGAARLWRGWARRVGAPASPAGSEAKGCAPRGRADVRAGGRAGAGTSWPCAQLFPAPSDDVIRCEPARQAGTQAGARAHARTHPDRCMGERATGERTTTREGGSVRCVCVCACACACACVCGVGAGTGRQRSAAQRSAAQRSAAQRSAAQRSAAQRTGRRAGGRQAGSRRKHVRTPNTERTPQLALPAARVRVRGRTCRTSKRSANCERASCASTPSSMSTRIARALSVRIGSAPEPHGISAGSSYLHGRDQPTAHAISDMATQTAGVSQGNLTRQRQPRFVARRRGEKRHRVGPHLHFCSLERRT